MVEIGPSSVSTSSGMWLKLIESDVSISSMMFGFTWAELVLVMGVLEMSVWAACSGETAKASAATLQPRSRPTAVRDVLSVFMTLLSGNRSGEPSAGSDERFGSGPPAGATWARLLWPRV
ncbi:MAG: hypothetical protein K8R60_04975 [Burkholderiales bacterium]|nr:hypothetical protein [Burkholderiales bacterium]